MSSPKQIDRNVLFYSHFSQVPKAEWRWPNFSPRELASKREGELKIHAPSLDLLQALRTRLGVPLLITSAYRSPAHNKAVGGAKNSYHMRGQAFDVRMDNLDPLAFQKAARDVGFTGIIRYPKSGFIHIDTRPGHYDSGPAYPATASSLPKEPPIQPETFADDGQAKAAAGAGAAGAVAVGLDLLPSVGVLGNFAPVAQTIAVVAVVLFAGYILWKRSR